MLRVAEASGYHASSRTEADGSLRVSLAPLRLVKDPAFEAVEAISPGEAQATALVEEPDVSVLFGTYERCAQLQRAVESIRHSAAGISYEIVVVDGGSSDGSREWLSAQSDVVLVGDRHLTGAVRAFNYGYRMCRGRFVANFNDDAVYVDRALAEAVARMDADPVIGQGIFAFRGEGEDFGINQIYPGHAGTEYANFGVARRDALRQVETITGGFWNPIYRTYAADCEQSAWIHRLGWTVARFEDLRVIDVRTKDDLRARNEKRQAGETKLMYYRWPVEAFRPGGPPPRVSPEDLARFEVVRERRVIFPAEAPRSITNIYAEIIGWPLPDEEERLVRQARAVWPLDPVEGKFPARAARLPEERVLYVSLATKADPQAGLDRALRALGRGGFCEVKWYEEYGGQPAALAERLVAEAVRLRPTLVFMQLQMPGAVEVSTIQKIRAVSDPRCVVASWNGDVADINSPWSAEWQVPLGRACDLWLHSSLSHVHVLRGLGVHSCMYLQIGFDEKQYATAQHRGAYGETYVACFLGSRYGDDAFSRSMKWHDARLRNDAVFAMAEAFGDRFGLYGRGWGRAEKVVPLDRAHEIYWGSKIGLNVSLANYLECYSSDRIFRIMGCGALLLTKSFPMMSVLGLRDGDNCVVWETPAEAVSKAKEIFEDEDRRRAIAEVGAKLARERHTWLARMGELSALVQAVRD